MKYKYLTNKKNELDARRNDGAGLSPNLVKKLEDWFCIELTHTSNALGGNTLTRRETALIVEESLTVGGKSFIDHLEVNNHVHAIEWVRELAQNASALPSEKQLLELHSLVLRGIDDQNAGCYRNVSANISDTITTLPHPSKVPELMTQFIISLRSYTDLHPVQLAAEAHYRLLNIHPFSDGNGRTARLLMNLILISHGYPPAIISKREKTSYINSLEKAQLGGSLDDYLKIISKAVSRSLDIYLKAIKGEDILSMKGALELVKIGTIAKRSELSVPTIRFWTKEGLLNITELTDSKYALYDSTETLAKIEQIQKLKKQRFTLNEIQEKLG